MSVVLAKHRMCPNCGHWHHDRPTCLIPVPCEDCRCAGGPAFHLCACTWPDPSNADETPPAPLTPLVGTEGAESSREICGDCGSDWIVQEDR